MIAGIHPHLLLSGAHPNLDALAERCRASPEFQRAALEAD